LNSPFDKAKYAALLEGPGIAEIFLSETEETPDFRVDAEFHKKPPADNPRYKYTRIGDILETSQYGISIEMNEDGQGFPIYRMNEITQMLCDAEILKCADVSETEAEPFLLKDRDVLFNRTNSQAWVGRTGIYKAFSNEKRIFASYLVRFVPDYKQVLPEYLAAFLSSSFGVWDVKRRARISINQSNVNPEEVKAIRIPLLSMGFQERITSNFEKAHKDIESSNQLYAQAETLLLDALKLTDWQPPVTNNYPVSSNLVWNAGRFDSEYFHPKYDAFFELMKKTAKDKGWAVETLISLSEPLKYGTSTELDYLESGVPFLRIADLSNKEFDAESLKYISPEAAFLEASATVHTHDVLISRSGSLGLTIAIPQELDGAVFGSYFIRTQPDISRINPDYLALFVNSFAGQIQIERLTTGGVQTNLTIPAIESLRVVVPSLPEQEKLVAVVTEARQAKRRAKSLLERAKRAVEVAIEESEAAGLAVLEEA
jgi:restriction endonuclease S subunit